VSCNRRRIAAEGKLEQVNMQQTGDSVTYVVVLQGRKH
jgi:hypothetical protein